MMRPSNSQPTPQPNGPLLPTQLFASDHAQFSADYHLKIGKSLIKRYIEKANPTDMESAIHHLQKALEMSPKLSEAYVQLAIALWEFGSINIDLAKHYCLTAIQLNPNCWEAHLYLGYFLQRSGLPEEALLELQQALKKGPLFAAKTHLALGTCHFELAQNPGLALAQLFQIQAQAVFHWGAGLVSLPIDPSTRFVLKTALLQDSKVYTIHSAGSILKKLGFKTLSRQLYELGTKLAPQEALFSHSVGDTYFYDLNNHTAAIAYYEQALERDPNQIDLMKKLAKCYVANQEPQKALAMLSRIIEIAPRDFEALYQIGQIYIEEHAYIKALYYLKEAAKEQAQYPYLHSHMGFVLFKLDDMEGALEEYKQALSYGSDPSWMSSVAQTIATILYRVYEDYHGALDYLQEALHYQANNREALATMGDLYFEMNQLDLALVAYKTLLNIEPDHSDCYSNIGYILWQMDRNEEAIDAYNRALELDQQNYIAHNNLGVIYLDEKDDANTALNHFKQAYQLKKDYTLACFNVARAQEKIGQRVAAAQFYSQAIQLNEENPELEMDEIQARLDQLFHSR